MEASLAVRICQRGEPSGLSRRGRFKMHRFPQPRPEFKSALQLG